MKNIRKIRLEPYSCHLFLRIWAMDGHEVFSRVLSSGKKYRVGSSRMVSEVPSPVVNYIRQPERKYSIVVVLY